MTRFIHIHKILRLKISMQDSVICLLLLRGTVYLTYSIKHIFLKAPFHHPSLTEVTDEWLSFLALLILWIPDYFSDICAL